MGKTNGGAEKQELYMPRNQSLALLGPCLVATYYLGRYLPPMTAFLTGPRLYTPANYKYDYRAVFDDSIYTWGTDYILAATHTVLCLGILMVPKSDANSMLRLASATLVGSFALSALCGALCHHFLAKSLNGFVFRMLWRVCVGAVGMAGGALGLCAGEIARTNRVSVSAQQTLKAPVFHPYFWYSWGVFFFFVIWFGLYSMINPACDIFLTGVTQGPPTLYLLFAAYEGKSWLAAAAGESTITILAVGLLTNAILLPGYDLMNYLQIADAYCNLMLHTVLFFAWSAQAIALRRICIALGKRNE